MDFAPTSGDRSRGNRSSGGEKSSSNEKSGRCNKGRELRVSNFVPRPEVLRCVGGSGGVEGAVSDPHEESESEDEMELVDDLRERLNEVDEKDKSVGLKLPERP